MEVVRTLLEDMAQYFVGPRDLREQLEVLRRDQQYAEAEIRTVLDRLASKYEVPGEDVDAAMESIGLALEDMTYERETEYIEELDLKQPTA